MFSIRHHDGRVGDAEQLLRMYSDATVERGCAEDAIDRRWVEGRCAVRVGRYTVVGVQLEVEGHDGTRETGRNTTQHVVLSLAEET